MTHTERFTHQGWFGICPIYIRDIETDEPGITPRLDNGFFEFLFWTSHYGFLTFFTVVDFLAPSWHPGFPIMVTGELLVPYTYEWNDDEAN
jgi:hypothetical protein